MLIVMLIVIVNMNQIRIQTQIVNMNQIRIRIRIAIATAIQCKQHTAPTGTGIVHAIDQLEPPYCSKHIRVLVFLRMNSTLRQ